MSQRIQRDRSAHVRKVSVRIIPCLVKMHIILLAQDIKPAEILNIHSSPLVIKYQLPVCCGLEEMAEFHVSTYSGGVLFCKAKSCKNWPWTSKHSAVQLKNMQVPRTFYPF